MNADGPVRILILGGGFAGVACAHRLEKRIHRLFGGRRRIAGREIEVLLLSRENYATFQPLLADVIGGSIEPRHVVSPVRRLLPRTTVVQADVESIDLEQREVQVRSHGATTIPPFRADHIVLALGREPLVSIVPGLAEHGLALRTLGDAFAIRTRIVTRLEQAALETDAAARERLLTFAVIGAGFSGVEVAGQIHDFLKSALKSYPTLPAPRVFLITRGPRILNQLEASLGAFALRKLRDRGIEVLLDTQVISAHPWGLRLGDGSRIDSGTVVSTIGNATHPVLERCELPRVRDRITVDAELRVPGYEGLWAAGDCAGNAPEMAQFAVREAALVADNILRTLQGKPLRSFTYKGLGQLASLGHRTGVAQVFGLTFGGLLAWWLWRTVYLFKLPSIDRRLRVIFDWTLDLFFRRDLVALDLKTTRTLGRAYYEAGNTIFAAGDPSETFYVIERGTIEILRTRGGGAPEPIAQLGPGEHFGEGSLLRAESHSATARAVTNVELLTLERLDFSMLSSALAPLRREIERSVKRRRHDRSEDPPPLPPEVVESLADRRVGDVMSSPAVTIAETATLGDALRTMMEKHCGCLPVVDAQQDLSGMVTRTNLYGALDERRPLDSPLADVLDARAITVSVDATVADAAHILRDEQLKRLIVVDSNSPRRVAGILSRLDLVRAHLDA